MKPRPTICEFCHHASPTVVYHHVFGKRYKHLIDDPDNKVALDVEHHTNSSIFSAHKTPARFKEWIISIRGEEWWQRLLEKKNRHPKDMPLQ